MIQFFRNFFKSKIGLGITFAFLALIALAFASSDVANTGTFGGISGGDRVAVVGDQKLGTADLNRAANAQVDRLRQENPTISMRAFIEQGGLEQTLEDLIDRTAIFEFARQFGLRAGTNLVNSEIIAISAFRGPDGNFSQDVYETALRQQGLSDQMVRDDIASGLLAQQLLVPASFGADVPKGLAQRYAALLKERRKGAIATIPSAAYAPKADPNSDQIAQFYQSNRARYIRPERRVLRYVTFDDEALDGAIEPTEKEVIARYNRDKQQYAASEERSFTQIIVPTEQGARALRDRIAGGASFDAVARQAGFQPTGIGPLTKDSLQTQSSQAVANEAFSAARGSIAPLARSALGWHVLQVDEIISIPERGIAGTRGEIAQALRQEKRRFAIAELSARVEEQIDEGIALSDLATELKAELKSTAPLTADGRIYNTRDGQAPDVLGPALATAFQMEEGEPQLAEIQPGELFLIYEVSQITESAAAPLKEIRDQVVLDWRRGEGLQKARAAADRILARLSEGNTLSEAVQAEKIDLPRIDQIDFDRQQLTQMTQGDVPAPLALMFSMAQGTAKKLEGPQQIGWFVVDLDSVNVTPLAEDDPLIERTQQELSQAVESEYAQQFVSAMRRAVGVERNAAAISAVRKQLTGEN